MDMKYKDEKIVSCNFQACVRTCCDMSPGELSHTVVTQVDFCSIFQLLMKHLLGESTKAQRLCC